MVIQFNIKDPEGLKEGELLVYNGKKFEAISRQHLFEGVYKDFFKLRNDYKLLEQKVKILQKQINKRQKRFLSSFVRKVK